LRAAEQAAKDVPATVKMPWGVGAALFGLIGAAGFLVTGWATLILQLIAGGVLFVVIFLLSALLVLPLGWSIAMANIYVDVTAETTPPGAWMVDLVEAPTSKEFGKDSHCCTA
jgi:hypothetical protein